MVGRLSRRFQRTSDLSIVCRKLIEFAEQHIEGGDLAHRAKHRLHKFIANDESSVRGIEGVFMGFNIHGSKFLLNNS